ncbi:MAG: 50S ribosomal protein L25 [Deltaproteobacteria bacterium]|nr:50S ribosomal protein L25 [Deltaproteobacteria bacterium]MCL5879458.1 50S ribosomal protein L25 [Deltaproteobacteria bacterium]MDA8304472.1 50S ribosomal protein L25 [Deltaproteobacteria bacterium]
MEIINLNVNSRNKEDNVKSLRKQGLIPAVIYGRNLDSLRISLNYKDFIKTFANHSISSFINIASKEDGINGKTAVIKEIQKDPVTDNIIHIDFHEVSMDEKIEIEAAIHFIGKPEGVKLGGILEPLMRHIAIKGYPKDIIDTINIDVASLQIGDIIHVKDLKLSDGIEIMADEDAPIVTVAEPAVEEVVAQPEVQEEAPAQTAQTQPKA